MPARRRWFLIAAVICIAAASFGPARAESVDFASTDAQSTKLTGHFDKPQGPGPFPATIMLHGCSGAYTARGDMRPIYFNYVDHLVSAGYAVLLVDSFRPRGYNEVCLLPGTPVTVFRHRPNDAFGAAKFLAARADIDAKRIALLGWSHGAISALGASTSPFAAAAKQYFRAVAVYYPACDALAARNYFPAVPTLVIVGLADNWTPAPPCIELARKVAGDGGNLKLIAYPDAYHAFDAPLSRAIEYRVPDRQRPGTDKLVRIEANDTARRQALIELDAFLAAHLKSR